jgi:hypothetical protein
MHQQHMNFADNVVTQTYPTFSARHRNTTATDQCTQHQTRLEAIKTISLRCKVSCFMVVTMKNVGLGNMMTPCDSCKNRRFGGTMRLFLKESHAAIMPRKSAFLKPTTNYSSEPRLPSMKLTNHGCTHGSTT